MRYVTLAGWPGGRVAGCTVLRAMLAEAVREELVERNVASIVKGPTAKHEEVKPWGAAEAATFLAAARGDRLFALFAVGVAVGLRRGELAGLRWEDVDLDQGLVHVRQTIQRVYGVGMVTGPPKSARSRRDVPLPVYAVQALKEHRTRQLEERLAMGRYWIDSGWCSPRPSGRAWIRRI